MESVPQSELARARDKAGEVVGGKLKEPVPEAEVRARDKAGEDILTREQEDTGDTRKEEGFIKNEKEVVTQF